MNTFYSLFFNFFFFLLVNFKNICVETNLVCTIQIEFPHSLIASYPISVVKTRVIAVM